MTTDVVVQENADGIYDIAFNSAGDIDTSQSLDTPILMSIFCEQRALPSEVINSAQRRGWIGNESTPNFEMGSKFWLFEQSRVTAQMLSELGKVLSNSLKWLSDDGISVNAEASAEYTGGKVVASVTIERSESEVDKKVYALWDNTGVS